MGLNEEYRTLTDDLTDLRRQAHERGLGDVVRFADESFRTTVSEVAAELSDPVVVFPVNEFGLPVALRPESVPLTAQNRIRYAVLTRKYETDAELNEIREEILDRHPRVHKVLVATAGESIRYHLPEATEQTTNFTSVRDAVGLVDWTTNGAERNCRQY